MTGDVDQFIEVAFANERCLLIIDEAGEAIGRAMSDDGAKRVKLATRSRHRGHSAYFIAQRPSMINRTIRMQCEIAYIFKQVPAEARILAGEFDPECLQAVNLARYECLFVGHYTKSSRFFVGGG